MSNDVLMNVFERSVHEKDECPVAISFHRRGSFSEKLCVSHQTTDKTSVIKGLGHLWVCDDGEIWERSKSWFASQGGMIPLPNPASRSRP
jgi:hypothetical protein